MLYLIKTSANLQVNFIRSENIKSDEKHEINYMIPFEKNQNDFSCFDNLFDFDYHKNLINKIINRLNTIYSPKTYKYFVFFRFSNKYVRMKCYQFENFSKSGVKGDQKNYRMFD